jgi:hypothetical protein
VPAERGSVGGTRIDPQSTFELIAELALALAGFGGVAAAFGGSNRSYAPAEIVRLQALFSHAFLALLVSSLTISLFSFGMGPASVYWWSSAAGALGEIPVAGYIIFRAYRLAADPTASTSWSVLGLITSFNILISLLLVASIVMGGSQGFLVSSLFVQLLFGLWAFTRVLTHQN